MIGLVLIGASTGAPRTHHVYLQHVPPGLAAPIVIIQHMPRGPFIEGMMKYLRDTVELPCRMAGEGDRLESRVVYLIEPGQQLRFQRAGRILRVAPSQGENYFAPSMDVTFASAADAFGPRVCAAIISGLHADQDGVAGCRAVRRVGGRVLVTTPATTPCYHMVAQIRASGEYDAEAPLERVLPVIDGWIREPSHATV